MRYLTPRMAFSSWPLFVQAHYDMEPCATHGRAIFGTYFEPDGTQVYGCLPCQWETDAVNQEVCT